MVQLHWPGLTLPHVQPPSFGLRCFDSFTTNRVEQENGNLKEGQTGLKSTSSLAQVMGVTTHRDQKRKGKTLRKSYREEASTPVKLEPILANLYHLLPTTVLVMLEKQCARVDRFRVVSLVRGRPGSNPTLKLRTSQAGRYGLGVRERTIRLLRPLGAAADDPARILICDCKHFDR